MKNNSVQYARHLNERGLDYEESAARFLRESGYTVSFDRAHEVWDTDVVVSANGAPDIHIEVKGSRLRKLVHNKFGYGFLLHKANRSKPIHEPITILVCHDRELAIEYFFIIPSAHLRLRHYLEFRDRIPFVAANAFAQYYKALDVLDALGAQRN